jgi:aspartate/methionine/tyrosine aminotransferase
MSGALRHVPYMGVIYVVSEAAKLGYHGEHPDWCNLGQGMPEVGPLPDAPPRVERVDIDWRDHAYGPVNGLPELRRAVAELYNVWFRRGKEPYAAENVAIAAGGRLSLSRAVAALGNVNIGYFLPDYTAYEDMLGAFSQFGPIPIPLDDDFGISMKRLEREIVSRGLKALVISNPCNPTGRVIRGKELRAWVELARRHGVMLLMDEFYSHYVWSENGIVERPVSTAEFVEDPARDPVILFDGLTKNYRYPGWRVGWTVGPRDAIETLTCAGSFLDGGGPRPLQREVVKMIEPARAQRETMAMRRAFAKKRDLMARRLLRMGIELPRKPEGTFYCWGSVRKLRPPLDDGFAFFREALKRKVITVPGVFFDVNPGKRRPGPSPYRGFVRFSFGAPYEVVERGLDRLEEMVSGVGTRKRAKAAVASRRPPPGRGPAGAGRARAARS